MSQMLHKPTQYEGYFNHDTPQQELMDKVESKKKMRKAVLKHYRKDMRNLYHGKVHKTGNDICHSQKRHRRQFRVNVFLKKHYSEILDKNFIIYTSTKALKCMRKYGGFDNYILLTRPQSMQSTFGEYLRQCMYRSMMSPGFKVHTYLNEGSHKQKGLGKKERYKRTFERRDPGLRDGMWHPPEMRYKDLSKYYFRDDHELPKRDLAFMAKARKIKESGEEIDWTDPDFKRMQDKFDEEEKAMTAQLAKHQAKHGVWDPWKGEKKKSALYDAHIKEAEKIMEQQSRIKIDGK